MVENSFKKHKVDQVLAALEGITFNFNKTVPLDLNMAIKKHIGVQRFAKSSKRGGEPV